MEHEGFHNGRFAKGNKVAVGHKNPTAKKREQFHRAVEAAVSIADLKEIMEVLVAEAKGGDTKSAELVLERCLGKVPQAVTGQFTGTHKHIIEVEFKNGENKPFGS